MPHDDSAQQKPTHTPPDSRSAEAASPERRVGRHRAEDRRPRGRTWHASTGVRVALAAGVTCCLGVGVVVGTQTGSGDEEPLRESLADRAVSAAEADRRASRTYQRDSVPSPGSSTSASASAQPTVPPRRPVRPKPVAGLTQRQMDNAKTIVDIGVGLRLPRRALVVAVATAMQESDLHNLANDRIAESSRYPHQGSGTDHDSLGLFQQRPSSGWGSVRELMQPAYAARVFYRALREVPGWQELSVTAAAQAVQRSAYPGAYAKHERRATTVVDALT
ncbi:hypothetical protein [Micromonospora inyonensis]|uniref:Peptidase M23 n=1 Tax=Micromonospora inyonensis TaxID=47866 RepID=A0A1C6SH23_9ACTN|nr:hypothetical protein [Micromonospora inyonensis]SCL28810.1 hypothetical protein GA0074694_5216 [Micromonospora inyonensis]